MDRTGAAQIGWNGLPRNTLLLSLLKQSAACKLACRYSTSLSLSILFSKPRLEIRSDSSPLCVCVCVCVCVYVGLCGCVPLFLFRDRAARGEG
jgi:hypothetical protein